MNKEVFYPRTKRGSFLGVFQARALDVKRSEKEKKRIFCVQRLQLSNFCSYDAQFSGKKIPFYPVYQVKNCKL